MCRQSRGANASTWSMCTYTVYTRQVSECSALLRLGNIFPVRALSQSENSSRIESYQHYLWSKWITIYICTQWVHARIRQVICIASVRCVRDSATLVRYSHKDALLSAAANSQRDARNFNLDSLAAVVVGGDAQVEIILVPTVWKVWLVCLIFKILRETWEICN